MMRYLSLLVPLIATACGADPDPTTCTEDLLETDRQFARYSVENGPIAAFEHFLTDSSMQLPAGSPPIFGRAAIVEAMQSGLDFELDWTPRLAEAAHSCDLGWTWGTYEATSTDSLGAFLVSTGKYINVWRRNREGEWRVLVDAGNQSGEPPQRRLRRAQGAVLQSTALPAASITVEPSFEYVGRYEFTIEEVANGERYVFVDTDGNTVKRLFVAHFEGILPESDVIFRYSFNDALEMGGFRFKQNVWSYRTSESRARNPDGEGAKLADLLQDRGFEIGDHLAMSRYVMVPDAERKHEMILIYMEPIPDSGFAVDEVADDLHKRATSVFSIKSR